MTTGFVWDERMMWHDAGRWAGVVPPGGLIQPDQTFEHPETKRRLRNLLDATGLLDQLVPIQARMATLYELLRLHTAEYLERLRALSQAAGGDAGEVAPFGHGSFDLARLAVGGVIEAVDAVLDGRVDNAYALVRPPGHHAEADRGRGFCLLGNVALGVLHAQAVRRLERIAVVDWDVHHGNGTQSAFYSDPRVLAISIHQDRNYPVDSGGLDENGSDAGAGFTLNVPLPPGCGHEAYLMTMDRVVVPALQAFRPELILVACGFDANLFDPLGRMLCVSETFRAMTRALLEQASDLCEGRAVFAHEGGYSTSYVPPCGLAVIEELAGIRTDYEDAVPHFAARMGGYSLEPHQKAAIDAAAELLAGIRS